MTRRLGYLSGAPRVSTRNDAGAAGPRSHVVSFIKAMEAEGWDVHAFIVGDRISHKWTGGKSADVLHRWGVMRFGADIARLILGSVNARRAWHELGRVDWAYERFAVLQALGRRFQRHGVPWILETNGPFFYEATTQRKSVAWGSLLRRLEVSAYRSCDVLICVTETLKEMLVREAGLRPEKIIVVPNGVDTDFFDPVAHQPHRLFDGMVVGFVGGLIEWQGLHLLLKAVADLRSEGIPVSAVLVGDGVERKNLESQAASLGLRGAIRFTGSVSWELVPSYIAGMDVGFSGQIASAVGMYHSPLKLYEYMAMARPVVASAYEDARRVIRDGETGYLFEPDDVEGLKRALRRAWQARQRLGALGARGRELMVASHTWRARVRCLVPEIERILRKSDGAGQASRR